MTVNKIVLAYSGGLDTSVILKWLEENFQCPVVAFAADLGQDEDWDAVREKGMATGAEKVVIKDLIFSRLLGQMPFTRGPISWEHLWPGRLLPRNRLRWPRQKERMQ